jgi:glycosyltransferase involved in cell wall biosynthesis
MGGAQYQAKILVENLISTNKFDIYYLARRVKSDFCPEGYEIVKIPGPNKVKPYRFFQTSFSLLKILKEIGPDIIYQQVGNAYTGISAYYAQKNRCKMIWRVSSDKSLTNDRIRFSSNIIYEWIDNVMMKYGIRNAGTIIVQTPHQGALLERNFYRKADAVIRNFHPHPEENIKKTSPIKVLWIANFKKLKQPEIFLKLAQDFGRRQDVQFIMIGAPAKGTTWFSRLEEEIGQISNLSYLGPLPQSEVNKLIAKSQVLVNTSQYEGFSNTFIQAWMRKVPVITLNINPDNIFKHHRIGYCAEGSYMKLLQYTDLLVSNRDLLQEMGEESMKYAFEFYSLKNIEKIVDIFTGWR